MQGKESFPIILRGRVCQISMKLNIYYLLFFDGPVAQFKFYTSLYICLFYYSNISNAH